MNVLEKILEEIERLEDPYYKDYMDRKYVKEIIHSHMGGATDTDDTEEKIREHIAECLHRIDNIRSFIGSKEYTSNDEKCIRNIEVLKTSITALEEYLSSKKKNSKNDWIPVYERLPEKTEKLFYDMQLVTLEDGEVCLGVYINQENEWWTRRQEGEKLYTNKREVIAWQPLPEQYRPKEKNNE